MHMTLESIDAGIVRVALAGRLDTPGVDAIETRLTASLVPRGDSAIVDLSAVEFAGSMAIRMFISLAKALARHGKRIALLSPQPAVAEVFDTVELGKLIPIESDAAGALARVRG